ncbi:Mot3p NDAI_0H01400 [Naumovozyma dairenensis CBS 421]|uniref:C2H2-type domain-containing protein n=1 Tax=Naumovozyma dairenensis (strain ATCC 10597 / BCRC 20456 / CBS 421 / NBRC 0211 / NRRL Y-12639) TaxID=1071378 RepID=G0WEV3_NAUDC|nr:hypothetical protein NDAI_0H01400 [Naumovozyma dairenensis CBS 421]CCD26314.1 hypothetical protein NDAI_0H01400 [Naumovozyma dairenensis CBS 421]
MNDAGKRLMGNSDFTTGQYTAKQEPQSNFQSQNAQNNGPSQFENRSQQPLGQGFQRNNPLVQHPPINTLGKESGMFMNNSSINRSISNTSPMLYHWTKPTNTDEEKKADDNSDNGVPKQTSLIQQPYQRQSYPSDYTPIYHQQQPRFVGQQSVPPPPPPSTNHALPIQQDFQATIGHPQQAPVYGRVPLRNMNQTVIQAVPLHSQYFTAYGMPQIPTGQQEPLLISNAPPISYMPTIPTTVPVTTFQRQNSNALPNMYIDNGQKVPVQPEQIASKQYIPSTLNNVVHSHTNSNIYYTSPNYQMVPEDISRSHHSQNFITSQTVVTQPNFKTGQLPFSYPNIVAPKEERRNDSSFSIDNTNPNPDNANSNTTTIINNNNSNAVAIATILSMGEFDIESQSYRCRICEKKFKRRSWLKRHLLSHSSERHYLCPWCLSRHKRRDNLLQHMKLKHPNNLINELKLRNFISSQTAAASVAFVTSAAPSIMSINDGMNNTVAGTVDNAVSTPGYETGITIKDLISEGLINKEDVKRLLNILIDEYNN